MYPYVDFIGPPKRLGDVLADEERVGHDPAADDHHQGPGLGDAGQGPILNYQSFEPQPQARLSPFRVYRNQGI